MVFSSLLFLSLFLPIFLVLYYLSPSVKYKNIVLMVASLLFYSWGEPIWVLALIFSGTADFIHGLLLEKYENNNKARKLILFSSLFLNLGLLFVFKYSNFFVDNINAIFGTDINIRTFTLPLGISFYTFQTLSYTIDAYFGKIKIQKSYVAFLAYVSMFPQLIAGPIVRYIDIEKNLNERKVTINNFSDGVNRFIIGLGKKVILANSAGAVVQELYVLNTNELTFYTAWLGVIFYSFQIYFDFAGYSDMAIGLGKMIGFDFKENFNYPYISKSITDFWRRWHISLGTFFRDYIYIPLGGNRRHAVLNLFIVWFITGLWHGASWNFILWGLYFGVILFIEKTVLKPFINSNLRVLQHIYSIILIVIGWAIFYFTDMAELSSFFVSAFHFTTEVDGLALLTLESSYVLLITLIFASTPLPAIVGKKMNLYTAEYGQVVFNVIIFIVSFSLILSDTFNPFLYFRF